MATVGGDAPKEMSDTQIRDTQTDDNKIKSYSKSRATEIPQAESGYVSIDGNIYN